MAKSARFFDTQKYLTKICIGSSYEQFDSGLIPVPSRLYFGEPSPSLPLNGARVGIKDIFDISGVSTSAGSRAFEVFHGNSKSSAASVQHLIDMGAVIVGKTKTTQFASGEYAQDWVDYQCPFNPRGDGYFDPSCSSAGSAAALAAYKWLDFSIGTDSQFPKSTASVLVLTFPLSLREYDRAVGSTRSLRSSTDAWISCP